MPGLRILHVHPRLAGPVDGWSGQNAANGRSWLIGHALELRMNAIWFGPFYEVSDVPTIDAAKKSVTGSLYAVRDYFSLGKEFSAGGAAEDRRHLRHFLDEARRENITVMADLVFNHVAADHPLVIEENGRIADIVSRASNIKPLMAQNGKLIGIGYRLDGREETFLFKFSRNHNLEPLNLGGTTGYDTVQINYDSPEARAFFVDGKDGEKGYWKKVIDWHLDLGFTGFRCDMAYRVPASWWQDIIQYAHDESPEVVFMAETLGDDGQATQLAQAEITVNGEKRKAFDLSMLGTYWWNFKDEWMIGENKRMQSVARFGGAGSPDTHDTDNTVAGIFINGHEPEAVANICLRDYAVAALVCNSVYMQMGYEYCRPQVSVFREEGLTGYWNRLQQERGRSDHPLNLIARIRAVNDFKEKLDEAEALVRIDRISTGDRLVKIECALVHERTHEDLGRLALYINEKPEMGPVKIARVELAGKDRLVLCPADREDGSLCDINDVAAFYTPLSTNSPTIPPPPQNPGAPRPTR